MSGGELGRKAGTRLAGVDANNIKAGQSVHWSVSLTQSGPLQVRDQVRGVADTSSLIMP